MSKVLPPLYGVINGVMLIPVSISFTSIIYSDDFFTPYLPSLVKLVLFSSMIHQIAFTLFSSLPFAVGQVQDAGLIFLSAMATTTVQSMMGRDEQPTKEVVLSTVLVELSLSTFLLGVILVVMGKLKFAGLVQYLPVPVIGGYLAFIGYFCGRAGIQMMSGPVPLQWLPGLIMGIAMYVLLRTIKSPMVLPVCMFSMLAFFYVIMLLLGASMDTCRRLGWIYPLQSYQSNFLEAFDVISVSHVDWSEIPKQFLRWCGMTLVVAFSSLLDVAAIEMELGLPLDYNRELEMVGLSNVMSGMLGGYTGSYIFSQTLFTMRRGIFSRICGACIVLFELLVVLLPFSVTSYVPKFFFGSLLILISVDLMFEWLIMVRLKMMAVEYCVVLLTFASIQLAGVEGGLALGILFASVAFVISYATIATVAPCFKSSNVVRTFEERSLLIANRGKIVTLSLKGYVFFGSAVKILEDVKSRVVLNESHVAPVLSDFGFEMSLLKKTENEEGISASSSEHDDESLFIYSVSPLKNRPRGNNMHSNAAPPKDSGIVNRLTLPFPIPDQVYGSISPEESPGESPTGSPLDIVNVAPKQLCVYDMSGDVITRLHERWENFQNTGSTVKEHSLLTSLWSSQTTFREAKKGSVSSFADMQYQTIPSEKQLQDAMDHSRGQFRNAQPQGTVVDDSSMADSLLFQMGNKQDDVLKSISCVATEYLILDFSDTIGVDATAARSCFLMLTQLMKASKVKVVFANMSSSIHSLFNSNGVVHEGDIVIPKLDDALEWCEEQVLAKALRDGMGRDHSLPEGAVTNEGLLRDPTYYAHAWRRRHGDSHIIPVKDNSSFNPLPSINSEIISGANESSPHRTGGTQEDKIMVKHARTLRKILEDYLEVSAVKNRSIAKLLSSQLLLQFFVRSTIPEGHVVFDTRQSADHIYFLEDGTVELVSVATTVPDAQGCGMTTVERVNKVSGGGIFGEAAFFLGAQQSLRCLTLCEIKLWTLSREDFSKMETTQPRMCLLIQHLLIKSLSINSASALYKLHPETAFNNLFEN